MKILQNILLFLSLGLGPGVFSTALATENHIINCNEAAGKIIRLLQSAQVTFSGRPKDYFSWQLSLSDHLALLLGRTKKTIFLKIKPILRANQGNYFAMEASYAKLQGQIYKAVADWPNRRLGRPGELQKFDENAFYAIVPSFQQDNPRPVLLLQVDPSTKLAISIWLLKIDYPNNTILDIAPIEIINAYP